MRRNRHYRRRRRDELYLAVLLARTDDERYDAVLALGDLLWDEALVCTCSDCFRKAVVPQVPPKWEPGTPTA